jgi:hypothetical protein
MKKLTVIFAAAAIGFIGRPGLSLADNYYSCVRESVAQCRYLSDEWESCRDLYVDIIDMCRSAYPPAPKKPHR